MALVDAGFTPKLLAWYSVFERPLPWRMTTDPYAIWLSEVILQQTRVLQGMGYYFRILDKYPTVYDLAQAPEAELMRLWQGLGYYRRALHMHACAQHIVAEYDGQFPQTAALLGKLPGIGPYTAAAVASIAFGEPVAAVDANVYRVLGRVQGITLPVNSQQGQRHYAALAQSLLPVGDAGRFNQALMDFGALQCKPRGPLCASCPMQSICKAYAQKTPEAFPIKAPKPAVRQRYFTYYVFVGEKGVYMQKRLGKDIWHGLYEPYCTEQQDAASWHNTDVLQDELLAALKPYMSMGQYVRRTHQLTHQKLHIGFRVVRLRDAVPEQLVERMHAQGLLGYTPEEQEELAKPVPVARFMHALCLSLF